MSGGTKDPLGAVIDRHAGGTVAGKAEVAYDKLGSELTRTEHVSDTETAVTTFVRDERGLPTKVVDPRGTADPAKFTTDSGYDALGQLTTVTAPPMQVESGDADALNKRPVTKNGFNAFGETTHTRDANGEVSRTGYSKAGRVTNVTLPDYTPPGSDSAITATTTTEYDAAGRVVAETDAIGNKTTFAYDELGNLRRVTDPPRAAGQDGGTTVATYTVNGQRLSVTNPAGVKTHWTYNQFGLAQTQSVVDTEPAERILTIRYSYDVLGNPASVTTPGGKVTTFEHDDMGNPTKMVDSAGVTTTAKFDSQGRAVKVSDPRTATTKLSYDWAGRSTAASEVDSVGATRRTRSFDYDLAGNQTVVNDALGAQTKRSFDALGQLTKVTQQVSETKSITSTFGYDATRELTRATDGNDNTTVFAYKVWGLVESTVEPATEQTPDAADRTYIAVYDAAPTRFRT